MNKYILTGGPGVGKTSILAELSKQQYFTVPEAARIVIEEEQRKEQSDSSYKSILPWTHLEQFQEMCLTKQIQLEAGLEYKRTLQRVFLDRSLVDPLAYAAVGKVRLRPDIYTLIENAGYSKAFFLEPLSGYAQDAQRQENEDKAKRLHEQIYETYNQLGFDLINVPYFTEDQPENITRRVQFILAQTHHSSWEEIEKKYRVSHQYVKNILAHYHVQQRGRDEEKNSLYDLGSILQRNGGAFRIRKVNQNYILTIKGPNRSSVVKKKFEANIPLPEILARGFQKIVPEDVSYCKTRETYSPLGDRHCKICFDYLTETGEEFVEIEAQSEHQVLLWEKRLELTDYAISQSYPEIVKRWRHETSRRIQTAEK